MQRFSSWLSVVVSTLPAISTISLRHSHESGNPSSGSSVCKTLRTKTGALGSPIGVGDDEEKRVEGMTRRKRENDERNGLRIIGERGENNERGITHIDRYSALHILSPLPLLGVGDFIS